MGVALLARQEFRIVLHDRHARSQADTCQLIINTGTAIVTFLMVFLIQNTQNRDGAAVHSAGISLCFAGFRTRGMLRFRAIWRRTARALATARKGRQAMFKLGGLAMTVEMWTLFGAMLLGLVHLTAASFAFKAQVGNAYTVGARDDDLRPSGVAARLDRAQRNFLETFAIFAAAVLMLGVLDRTGGWLSIWGAMIYLGGRVLFLPLYAVGVPWLRTLSWNAATVGLAMVMAAIVSPVLY